MAKNGGNPRSIPEGKSQINFNITDEPLKKVKYIAYKKDVPMSDIYNEAIEQYIEKFEKKEGKIKP